LYYNNDIYYSQFFRLSSLNDMVIEAMKAERHDRVKYQRMMEMTTDPAVIKQTKFAYDDEIKHYGMFQQIYR